MSLFLVVFDIGQELISGMYVFISVMMVVGSDEMLLVCYCKGDSLVFEVFYQCYW